MYNKHTRRGKTQNNIICHSRVSLSGIPTAFNNTRGGDPRLKTSGMTTLFNNGWYKVEALNKNNFRDLLRPGFTLIELLVVVLIIGILAAVAVPQYQQAVAASQYAELEYIAPKLAQEFEFYYLEQGAYPPTDSWSTFKDNMNLSLSACTNGTYGYLICPNFGVDMYDYSNKNVVVLNKRNAYIVWLKRSAHPGWRECAARPNDPIAERICTSRGGVLHRTYREGVIIGKTLNVYLLP